MSIRPEPDLEATATALQVAIGVLVRRLRQLKAEGDLTLAEVSALSRLDRGGASTTAELARAEGVTPQSMGSTIAALEARALVERRRDSVDGRKVVLSLTTLGAATLRERRRQRGRDLASALAGFSARERATLEAAAPLLERLAAEL